MAACLGVAVKGRRPWLCALVLCLLLGGCGGARARELKGRDEFSIAQRALGILRAYDLSWGDLEARIDLREYARGQPLGETASFTLQGDGRYSLMYFAAESRAMILDHQSQATQDVTLSIQGSRGFAAASWEYGAEDFYPGAELPLYCVYYPDPLDWSQAETPEEAIARERALLFVLCLDGEDAC